MKTLKLVDQNNCIINHKIGKEISDGADGQVFELADDFTKVIKISVLFDLNRICNVDNVLNYLYNNYTDAYARVYEYKKLGSFKRNIVNGEQEYILYYYIMEKCQKISEDEKKVFHSIISHEDRGFNKNYSLDFINKMLIGLSRGIDFDKKKVMLFCEKLKQSPIQHLDLHTRNIMKNNGEFKLVDFDRCIIRSNYER